MPFFETETFERRTTREKLTGRELVQLTSGPDCCQHLYYFNPCVTRDGREIIFYRYRDEDVQNWKLDVATGLATRLTNASTSEAQWRPWQAPAARGVRELLSMFCPATGQLYYFDGLAVREVSIDDGADRLVWELPVGRFPCGLGSVSPDGRHLVVPHVDREQWQRLTANGCPKRPEFRGLHLELIDTATGHSRPLLNLNTWITHADFLGNDRIIFSSLATESAILMTGLEGGWYIVLRPETVDGLSVNHRLPTRRGIMYETVSPNPRGVVGHCDPQTYRSRDFFVEHPVHHLGHDPEGLLWIIDSYRVEPRVEKFLGWIPRLVPGETNRVQPLTGGFTNHGDPELQRSHPHPTVMPDRRNLLFCGPDPHESANHLFLLDISDLVPTVISKESTGTSDG